MAALTIIKHFDVFEYLFRGFLSCRVGAMINKFLFDSPKERLGNGIIPALGLAAHAADKIVVTKALLIVMTRILTAAIRVHQKPRRRLTRRDRLIEGLYHKRAVNTV